MLFQNDFQVIDIHGYLPAKEGSSFIKRSKTSDQYNAERLERILFGTDSNGFPRGFSNRYLQEQVRVCREINMQEDAIETIFENNARRLLHLEKGVKQYNARQ